MGRVTGPVHGNARFIDEPRELERDCSPAARFVRGMRENAITRHIANAHSLTRLLALGDQRWPVTVEDGRYGDTYIASPHSAYVLYARDEIDIVGLTGLRRWGSQAAVRALDRWLRGLELNKTVHLDNWLLSTSLHGRWEGAGLERMRETVVDAYPDHLPVIRCLDPWSCPALLDKVRSDGWTLLPARQVWVTDDLEAKWRPRSHTKSDRRAMRRSGLEVEELESLGEADAERIAELYTQLYLGRYSTLNPAYSAAFVRMSCDAPVLRWRVARGEDGVIRACAGMRVAGDIVTVPLLGYDTTRPQAEALYRIASLLSLEWACERGYRHHGSSGAGTFKSKRGARGVIEYMAVHTSHLPRGRRLGIKAFAQTLESAFVPALQKQGW